MSASFHYSMYCLIAIVAIAELTLTVFLFEDVRQDSFTGVEYHNLLITFMGISAWSVFFGLMYAFLIRARLDHFLENVSVSIWWLIFTSIIWVTTIMLFHKTRQGDICDGSPALSRCRRSLTVESLGWTEFALCLFVVATTWVWISDDSPHMTEGSWTISWSPGRESTIGAPSSLRYTVDSAV